MVGNEELVTAEAGRRVALSSGGKVVAVFAASRGDDLGEVPDSEPDVVLLTGGTDGGNPEPILACARALAASWQRPGRRRRQRRRPGRGRPRSWPANPLVVAPNIVPRIGVLAPEGARTAIRELFLSHVIGGKHLSSRDDFLAMVQGATPDVVLTGVELLAEVAGDTVVVDVGGATTDVHSVVELDPEDAGLSREVVATTRVTRTVEGDLGMRWSAVTTAEAAGRDDLADAARTPSRRTSASSPPTTPSATSTRSSPARPSGLALRRHAGRSKVVVSPEGRVVERSGKDLREVDLLVGSGGVLRHGRPGVAERIFAGQRRRESRAAGSCRGAPRSPSTPTTSWPPPGCSPPSTATRPAASSRRLAGPEVA